MIAEKKQLFKPNTLEEFIVWDQPEDGFKYEWNDGELIQFTGMNKNLINIFAKLNNLFISSGFWNHGVLVSEYDVWLTGIQMRRPDIAYINNSQLKDANNGIEVIPEFVIEIISETDKLEKVEEKVAEYFKAGVKVLWHIMPNQKLVYVYNSRTSVQIFIENDLVSSSPVLNGYEIKVNDLFRD